MRKALILVNPYFPTGVAISSRMLNFGRLLRDAGWSVHVITGHTMDGKAKAGEVYDIEGITYQFTTPRKPSSIDTFVGDHTFIKALEVYLKDNHVNSIFMNATSEIYYRVLKLARKWGAKLFVEQCEWLDISNYKFGKADIRLWNTQHHRMKGFKKATGIISISRLLDEHYKEIGAKTIRIPTILDVESIHFQEDTSHDGKIHVVFAGSLGGSKELMKPIIEALVEKEEYRNRIQFDIYGPSKAQIITNLGGSEELLNKCGDCISIHGRIPQEEIPRVYSESDFLIFVRPQRRSSNAGFPTKLAESMSVGTPVISNDTGDIALYLKDGENGFLLSDNTKEAVIGCFDKCLSSPPETYRKMRAAARKTAEESFDYRCYQELVSSFFETGEI